MREALLAQLLICGLLFLGLLFLLFLAWLRFEARMWRQRRRYREGAARLEEFRAARRQER